MARLLARANGLLSSGTIFFFLGSCATNLSPAVLGCVIGRCIMGNHRKRMFASRVNLPVAMGNFDVPTNGAAV